MLKYDSCPGLYQTMPRDPEEAIEVYLAAGNTPIVGKTTAITSLGSCFADNIRIHLKHHGFNYLQLEPDCDGFTANWGRIYNAGSLRQILEYSACSSFTPAERWWSSQDGTVLDPYRAVRAYETADAAARDFEAHVRYSRESFMSADVVVLTIGLTEAWRSRLDGSYFHRRPPDTTPDRHAFHVMAYEDVCAELHEVFRLAKLLNPAIKLIFTVSPVPLRATFRSDVGAVSASAYSKAVLIAAVHTFSLSMPDCFYFPSFEIVRDVLGARINSRGTYDAGVIATVMQIFERFYCV